MAKLYNAKFRNRKSPNQSVTGWVWDKIQREPQTSRISNDLTQLNPLIWDKSKATGPKVPLVHKQKRSRLPDGRVGGRSTPFFGNLMTIKELKEKLKEYP